MTIEAALSATTKAAGTPAAGDKADKDAAGLFAGLLALLRADGGSTVTTPDGGLDRPGNLNAGGNQGGAAKAGSGSSARSEVTGASAPLGQLTTGARELAALVAELSSPDGRAAAASASTDKPGGSIDTGLLEQVRAALAASGATDAGTAGTRVAPDALLRALKTVASESQGEVRAAADKMLAAARELAAGRLRLTAAGDGGIKITVAAPETKLPTRAAPSALVALQAATAGDAAPGAGGRARAVENGRPDGAPAQQDRSGATTVRPDGPARRIGPAPFRPTELPSAEPRPMQTGNAAHTPAQGAGAQAPQTTIVEGLSGFGARLADGSATAGATASSMGTGLAAVSGAASAGTPGAPAPAGPQANAMAQQAAQQVANGIQRASAGGQGRVQIQLHPRELGRVDVRMEFADDGLRVRVSVERAETFDMMSRDARALERALQDAGVRTQDGGLTFDLKGQGRHANKHGAGDAPVYDEAGDAAGDESVDDVPADAREPRGGWTGDGRFDLTV